jgi:hypothetical protein
VQEASGATPTAVKEAHGVSSALAQQVRDVSLEDPPQHAKKALTIDDYEVEEVEEEEGEGDKDLLLSRSGRPVRQAAKRALGLDSDRGSPPLEAHLRIPYKDKGKAKEATRLPSKKIETQRQVGRVRPIGIVIDLKVEVGVNYRFHMTSHSWIAGRRCSSALIPPCS